jgi:hypothetical protein
MARLFDPPVFVRAKRKNTAQENTSLILSRSCVSKVIFLERGAFGKITFVPRRNLTDGSEGSRTAKRLFGQRLEHPAFHLHGDALLEQVNFDKEMQFLTAAEDFA